MQDSIQLMIGAISVLALGAELFSLYSKSKYASRIYWYNPSSAFDVPLPSVNRLVHNLPIGPTLGTAALVYWFWSLAGFHSVLDVKVGIPDLKATSPNSRIGCFVCFSILIPRPQVVNKAKIPSIYSGSASIRDTLDHETRSTTWFRVKC